MPKMFWTTDLWLLALTLSQVVAGVVQPEVFNEDASTEVSTGSRIAFGWEAYPGQFPYAAALRIVSRGGDVTRCAGSVVHHNWILTSARCVADRTDVIVNAGVTDLTSAPEYICEDTELWIHPTYDLRPSQIQNTGNIALLKLQQPLTYSKLVQPIRIQPSAEAFVDYADEVLITCGWGRLQEDSDFPDVLNWVYLRGISNTECSQIYTTVSATSVHICATSYNVTSQSICYGDSGGPLVHIGRDGGPVLVGVAAFWTQFPCHTMGRPSGYLRPGAFHSWLTEVTGIDFESLNEENEVTETPESTTTEVTEPSNTGSPEPPTTESPETTTTESPEPPTTESPEPPTTESPETTTTESPEPPTTEGTEPPSTDVPEPDSEEDDQNSNDSDSSESKEDLDIISQPLNKRLKVINISKVKVKNYINIK